MASAWGVAIRRDEQADTREAHGSLGSQESAASRGPSTREGWQASLDRVMEWRRQRQANGRTLKRLPRWNEPDEKLVSVERGASGFETAQNPRKDDVALVGADLDEELIAELGKADIALLGKR
jgi:hypothetical protein